MRILTRIITVVFLLLCSTAFPQSADSIGNYDERLYISFVSSNMLEWESVIVDLEHDYQVSQNSQLEFKLLHAQYGYIGFLIGSNNRIKAQQYIAQADLHIQNLLKVNSSWVEVNSIKAAILAYKIAIDPYLVFYLGFQCRELLDNALTQDPENSYALIEEGNYRQYAPLLVGGNPAMAINAYQQALASILKQNNDNVPRTWWYLNTLTQLALAAEKAQNNTLASITYAEILSIEPNFKWVKDELYPRFLKKINSEN